MKIICLVGFLFGVLSLSARSEDLFVDYTHPAFARITVTVPVGLRGEYEQINKKPQQHEVLDRFVIYDCALPKRMVSDDHPMAFQISIEPVPEVKSMDQLEENLRGWAASVWGKDGIEDHVSRQTIAGREWLRIDQLSTQSAQQRSGVLYETMISPGRMLFVSLGAVGVGHRATVNVKQLNPYMTVLDQLMPSITIAATSPAAGGAAVNLAGGKSEPPRKQ